MERNAETLSTRDLASPNEPAGGARTSEDDARNEGTPKDSPRYTASTPRRRHGSPSAKTHN